MNDVLRGPRAWLVAALCAGGVASSLGALGYLIAPGRWLAAGVVAVVALAAVVSAVRASTRAWWLPTAAGALVGLVALLIAYAGPPGRLQLIPDRESVARLGDLLRAGLQVADASRPPADPTIPLEVIVVGGAMLVLLAVDLIAIGLGAPAWSGLALLALWIPPLIIGRPAGTWPFVGTALCYLLLLAATAAPDRPARRARAAEERRRRVVSALSIAGVVTVVALVAGPVGPALPGWSQVRLPQVGSVAAGSLRLTDNLDMRQSLGTRSSDIVLSYAANPVPAGPLRVFTLRDYDGERWSPETDPTTEAPPVEAGSLLWPARDLTPEPPGEGPPAPTRLDVRLEGLEEERLPVPVMPRTVEVGGSIGYDARRDEVVRSAPTSRGLEYSMDVQLLDLTAETLRDTDAADPRDVEDYLSLPSTSRSDDVAARAQEIVAGHESRYDQALALQSYFRSAQNFTYTTEVDPARSDDAVWDFLGSRTGYCVQFATAMTVMARTLGIPARLAVGYLPGSPDDDGRYVVTGRDSHAWPELYFPATGWIRFEPTPAVQSGAPPRWADPFLNTTTPLSPETDPTAAAPVTPAPSTAPVPQAQDATQTADADGWGAPAVIAAAGALLLVLVAAALLLRRRMTVAEDLRPEVAWAHLRRRLAGAGITWTDAQTPRQAAARVAAAIEEQRGSPMDPAARSALQDLARAVEEHRYAVAPRVWEHAELEQRVALVLRDATRTTPTAARAG